MREGGGYYRIRMPVEELGRHGHETVCEASKTDVAADGADIVAVHMAGSMRWRDAAAVHRWWRRLSLQGCRRVYELDDDPFNLEHTNPAHAEYNAPNARDSLEFCIRAADLVTTSVEPLAERMRRLNPNVAVCRNRIPASLLDLERPRRDKVVIGWAGGPSHFRDIQEAMYGIRRVADREPAAELHFIGSNMTPLVKRPARHTRWAAITTDYYKLIDFDIGLAPLRPGIFTDAKSYIKVLEYAALGIPCVASDVTPYRDFVVDGVTGYLVSTGWQWADRLRDLINDPAMREEMGAKAKVAAADYTIETGWRDWESAYRSIL